MSLRKSTNKARLLKQVYTGTSLAQPDPLPTAKGSGCARLGIYYTYIIVKKFKFIAIINYCFKLEILIMIKNFIIFRMPDSSKNCRSKSISDNVLLVMLQWFYYIWYF